MYGEGLRKRFRALAPVVDDLFLLEPHQIACLPKRAPRGELAAVLREYPKLVRFFSVRHPPIEPFLSDLLHAAPSLEMDLAECKDRLPKGLFVPVAGCMIDQRLKESQIERLELKA